MPPLSSSAAIAQTSIGRPACSTTNAASPSIVWIRGSGVPFVRGATGSLGTGSATVPAGRPVPEGAASRGPGVGAHASTSE